MDNKTCVDDIQRETTHHAIERPSSTEVWAYSILCTTIIVLSALGGLVAIPCIKGACYKRTLIFMVGLAVGTLAGSSLLFLVPEALELTEQELNEHSYVWKCLVMVSAIYVFFNIERLLKLYSLKRERIKRTNDLHRAIHGGRFASLTQESDFYLESFADMHRTSSDSDVETFITTVDSKATITKVEASEKLVTVLAKRKSQSAKEDEKQVAPVAWMIIFGDALHNLIDGVSLGAAFTESILAGVSVSVTILCEELPHELGDFAVLLNSGMSTKRAVLYNILSACTIYIGTIIGIIVGENMDTHTWVFAFAGGMFLYIALADMMPEMCAASELEENKKLIGSAMIFLLQNLGILTGFGVILLLAVYGGKIETSIKGE